MKRLFERIIDSLKFSAVRPGERAPAPAVYDPLGGILGAPAPDGASIPSKIERFAGIAGDFSSSARYTGGTQRITLNLRATSGATRADFPDLLWLSCGTAVANLGDTITLRAENLTIRYRTRHFANTLFSGYIGDDLQDGTALYMPITTEDQRSPRKEDALIAAKLIEHLNSNLEHYNKALWTNLDADRRYLLLDGFNIQIFNDFGEPVGLKSLASVVKNDLIAVAGNALVLPVASGFRVAVPKKSSNDVPASRWAARAASSKPVSRDTNALAWVTESVRSKDAQRAVCAASTWPARSR